MMKNKKMELNVHYSKIKSDFIENDQVREISPFSEVFGGKLKEKNQCKICNENFYKFSEFMMLNFNYFNTSQKNLIEQNRQNYRNLLEDEICSKRHKILRTFEKFQVGVFDYIYNFLHKDEIEGLQTDREFKYQQFENFGFCENSANQKQNIFYCQNCMMEINVAKKYSIIDLPHVLMLGFKQSNNIQQILNFKLELKLNLSYFLTNQQKGKSLLFTKEIIEINNIITNDLKQSKFNSYVYELRSFVRKIVQNNTVTFETYLNNNEKWIKINNFGEEEISVEKLNRTNKQNNFIIFCIYEKQLNFSQKEQNLILALKQNQFNKIDKKMIPSNFLNKFLYLGQSSKISVDFAFCSHLKIKPQFEDIYQKNKNYFTKDPIIYENTKINQELIKENAFIQPSFSTLNYISNGDEVPISIYQFFMSNYYESKKKLNCEELKYFNQCNKCFKKMRNFALQRMYQKALMMNLLQRKNEKYFLIDQIWFKNYKLFLLADMKNDHYSRIFFNYNYVTEKINLNIQEFFQQFQETHQNDEEIMKREFVSLNQSSFQFLEKIYSIDQVVMFNENKKIVFYEKEEFDSLVDDLKLNFEEQFVYEKLTQNFDQIDEKFYQILMNFNEQMNALLDFQISNIYSVLKINENENIDVKEKVDRIIDLFKSSNIDNIKFDPCKKLFEIFAQKNNKLFNKRQTFVLDREKSNKMKNKFGYRKTVAINTLQNFSLSQLVNQELKNRETIKELASIDQQQKEQCKEQNQEEKEQWKEQKEVNQNIFSQINEKIMDFADKEESPTNFLKAPTKSDENNLDYTTSQIFSIEQSNLINSLIQSDEDSNKIQRESEFKNSQKFSLFIKHDEYNNIFQNNFKKESGSNEKLDFSSEIECPSETSYQKKISSNTIEEEPLVLETIQEEGKNPLNFYKSQESEEQPEIRKTIIDEKQEEGYKSPKLKGDIFDWIDEDILQKPKNENFSDFTISVQLQQQQGSNIFDQSVKKSHFSKYGNNEEYNSSNSQISIISVKEMIKKRKIAKVDAKFNTIKLIKNSHQILENLELLNQRNPKNKTKSNKFVLIIKNQKESIDEKQEDSILPDIRISNFEIKKNERASDVVQGTKKVTIESLAHSEIYQLKNNLMDELNTEQSEVISENKSIFSGNKKSFMKELCLTNIQRLLENLENKNEEEKQYKIKAKSPRDILQDNQIFFKKQYSENCHNKMTYSQQYQKENKNISIQKQSWPRKDNENIEKKIDVFDYKKNFSPIQEEKEKTFTPKSEEKNILKSIDPNNINNN